MMETTSEQLETQRLALQEPERTLQLHWKLLPSVNRQAIRAGRDDCSLVLRRQLLRKCIASGLNIFALHLLFNATTPPYSKRLYVAERNLLIVSGLANVIPQLLTLCFVLLAMTNRSVLLNKTVDSIFGTIISILNFLGLLSMLNLYFVEFYKDSVSEADIIPGLGETTEEIVIHHIYVGTVIIFSVIFWGLIIAFSLYYYTQKEALQAKQVNLLQDLELAKPLKYEASDRDVVPTECVLCLDKFKAQENVMQLKCDPRHVFHRQCLKQQLETKVVFGKYLKCTVCSKPI